MSVGGLCSYFLTLPSVVSRSCELNDDGIVQVAPGMSSSPRRSKPDRVMRRRSLAFLNMAVRQVSLFGRTAIDGGLYSFGSPSDSTCRISCSTSQPLRSSTALSRTTITHFTSSTLSSDIRAATTTPILSSLVDVPLGLTSSSAGGFVELSVCLSCPYSR